MTRQELLGRYGFKNYMIINNRRVVYKYLDTNGVLICLEHEQPNFWFEVLDDSGKETLSSCVFSNYTDEEKFETKYREFLKFYNLED